MSLVPSQAIMIHTPSFEDQLSNPDSHIRLLIGMVQNLGCEVYTMPGFKTKKTDIPNVLTPRFEVRGETCAAVFMCGRDEFLMRGVPVRVDRGPFSWVDESGRVREADISIARHADWAIETNPKAREPKAYPEGGSAFV